MPISSNTSTASCIIKGPSYHSAVKSAAEMSGLLDARRTCGRDRNFSQSHKSHCFRHCCSRPQAINRLPVEIVGEIFGLCLQDTATRSSHIWVSRRSISPSPYADPQVLGQVCRYWRGVTLVTPVLWSSICITYPSWQHVPRVVLWLQRSRAYGLSLKLTQPVKLGPGDHAVTDQILSLLITQVYRWREIEFSFSSVAQQPLLMISEGAASALKSATINNHFWDFESMNRLWRVVYSSPGLRQTDWTWPYNGTPDRLTLSQVTHVTLHWVFDVEILTEILSSCMQVVELRLHSLWSDYSPSSSPTLVLSNLRHLSITDASDPGPLFCRLTLPSLTSLEFTAPVEHRNDLLDLLDRSCCLLEKFSAPGFYLDEADLLAYLAAPQPSSLIEPGAYKSVA